MTGNMNRLLRDERGINALETAIILIAFVVVAAVFAFTILSAGTFTTERSKEAVYAGLEEVRGSLELRGGVIATATSTGTSGYVDNLVFTVANVAGGQPVDFTTGSDAVVVIEYRDSSQRTEITNWSTSFLGYNDGDNVLEERELVEVTVPLSGTLSTNLGVNTTFVVEVKPPVGAVLSIQRTTPANIDAVIDLK
jgi:flagellin FlaB